MKQIFMLATFFIFIPVYSSFQEDEYATIERYREVARCYGDVLEVSIATACLSLCGIVSCPHVSLTVGAGSCGLSCCAARNAAQAEELAERLQRSMRR